MLNVGDPIIMYGVGDGIDSIPANRVGYVVRIDSHSGCYVSFGNPDREYFARREDSCYIRPATIGDLLKNV